MNAATPMTECIMRPCLLRIWGSSLIALAACVQLFSAEIVGWNGKALDVDPFKLDVAPDGRIVFQTKDGKQAQIAMGNIAKPSQATLAKWMGLSAAVAFDGNPQKALRLAERGDALGDAYAAFVLAGYLQRRNPRAAFAAAMRSADRGDKWGALLVGAYYENGLFVMPSRSSARQWYHKAYDFGNGYAAVNLAKLAFREGRRVEAADWMARAVERFQEQRDRKGIIEVAQLAEDYGKTKLAQDLFALAHDLPKRTFEQAPTDAPSVGGTGSGWFVSKTELVTCWHVVQGCKRLSLYLPGQKREVPLTLVAQDTQNDIALLRVSDDSFSCHSPIILAKEPPALAAAVFTLGFPMQDLLGNAAKYTEGSVSALRGLHDNPTHVQVSVPIQPGNSGGPLLNERGEAVGMVTSTLNALYTLANSETLPQNVNYALKVDYVRLLLNNAGVRPCEDAAPRPETREQMVRQLGKAVFQIRARP